MDNESKSTVPSIIGNDFNATILHTLAGRLRCDICYNPYNTSVRAPTTLICGHTFCNKCIHAARHSLLAVRCFICFRNTAARPRQLDKNWLLTNLVEEIFPANTSGEARPCSPGHSQKKALEDGDDESDVDFSNPSEQMQVFNRLTQLVYDELFDVEQALQQARTDTQHDFTDTAAEVTAMQDSVAHALLRIKDTFTEVKQHQATLIPRHTRQPSCTVYQQWPNNTDFWSSLNSAKYTAPHVSSYFQSRTDKKESQQYSNSSENHATNGSYDRS